MAIAGINPVPGLTSNSLRVKRAIPQPVATQPEQDELKKQIAANSAESAALSSKNEGEIDAQLKALDAGKAASDAEEAKLRVNAPKEPSEPFHFGQKNLSDMTGMMLVLAALGGATTRAPFTAAMNNFSAALKGISQGNKEEFDQQYKAYEANTKRGLEAHRAYQDELKAIQEKHKGDYQSQMERIRLLQLKHGYAQDRLKEMHRPVEERLKQLHEENAAANNAAKRFEEEAKRVDMLVRTVRAASQKPHPTTLIAEGLREQASREKEAPKSKAQVDKEVAAIIKAQAEGKIKPDAAKDAIARIKEGATEKPKEPSSSEEIDFSSLKKR